MVIRGSLGPVPGVLRGLGVSDGTHPPVFRLWQTGGRQAPLRGPLGVPFGSHPPLQIVSLHAKLEQKKLRFSGLFEAIRGVRAPGWRRLAESRTRLDSSRYPSRV